MDLQFQLRWTNDYRIWPPFWSNKTMQLFSNWISRDSDPWGKKNCKQKCWSLQVPRFNYFREFSDYRACRDNWDELGKLDKLKHLNWESKENEKVKVHRRFFQREDCWTVRILNICTGSQLTIQLTSTYIWGNYSKCLANRGVCLPWGVL